MLPRRWPLCGSGMRDLHCKAMPFRPADNSPFRRHYAPMGATRRSLLCLCMCDGFSIAHRRENARIIAEAPPVAEKARRFRGSVPVFTPQRGRKPADTTVFRIAEAPPVAYFSQQFFLFVSDGILFTNSLFLASGTQSDFSQADTAEYHLHIPPSGIDKSARFQ